MSRHHSHQKKWVLAVFFLIGILLSLTITTAGATPFNSPQPDNTIHQPLVTNSRGAPVSQPAKVESQDIPVIWIILILVLLFIPATTFMAARRR